MDRRKLTIIVVTLSAILLVGQLSGVRAFVDSRGQAAVGQYAFELFGSSSDDNALLLKIKEEAVKRKVEPINAVNDRVWKAIPGYNGLEVDVDQTYQRALALKKGSESTDWNVDEIPFVYRELPAKVGLDQLGALPIYRGNPNKKMVSFMINVAWGNEYIIPMLDTLDAAKVKATFFLDGSWLKKNPELAKEIQRRGHQMENHAYSHPNMSQLSESRAILEISKTKDLLKETLGVDNKWFAPPSGDFNQKTVQIAAGQGLRTVLWTLDTVDWMNPSPESVVAKISKRVEAGSLILMHPTKASKEALKGMIDAVQRKGLKLGTVEETLSPSRIAKP
ncbi:Peptidoglycan-N-acetylglucosamine deacetylase [compost metagenome]